MKIGAVVLAAGHSRRMGTQKLLLPTKGRGSQPMIAGVVGELVGGPLEEIVVVVGQDAERIRQVLAGQPVSFVANPDPDGDMLSSVRCGVRALPTACQAILVALGDQPGLTRELVCGLVRAFSRTGLGIVVPAESGRRGHPVLFAARFRDEVLTRHDGVGLRGLLAAHPAEILQLEVAFAGLLADLDTPEAYERYLRSTAD